MSDNFLLEAPKHPKEAIKTEEPSDQLHRFNLARLKGRYAKFIYELSQMEAPATVAVLTPGRAFGCMGIFGLALLSYGIAILIACLSISEISVDFTNTLDKGTLVLPIPSSMSGDVFIYVRLQNVYQNVQWYANSYSRDQLLSGDTSFTDTLCAPWNNGSYPCGLIAASAFNDLLTFRIKRAGDSYSSYLSLDESSSTISTIFAQQTKNPTVKDYTDANSVTESHPFWLLQYFPPTLCRPLVADDSANTVYSVSLDSSSIPQCKNFNSANATCIFSPPCNPSVATEILNPAGWGVENSHFRNWMATAGRPTFLKLWAKVVVPLYAGDVVYVDVRQFWSAEGATKEVVITQANWQGGPDLFLPCCLIGVGILYILAVAMLICKWRVNGRRLGDITGYNFANASVFRNE